MPEVLDAGTSVLSNADVLDWLQSKRLQHAREDAEDKASKSNRDRKDKLAKRPDNFMKALDKHERELTDNKYPYLANPGAYAGEQRAKSLRLFDRRVTDEVLIGMRGEAYRDKAKGMTAQQLEDSLGKEQERMHFTDAELLVIFNHAPQIVEMLQPMIESYEERFTSEELERIVEIVQQVLRCGEQLPETDGEDEAADGRGAPVVPLMQAHQPGAEQD